MTLEIPSEECNKPPAGDGPGEADPGRQMPFVCFKQPDFTDVCQILAGISVLLGRITVLRRCGLLLQTE